MSKTGLQHITKKINEHGPISVGEYMRLALLHPEYGYYQTRDPLGKDGDFITSPEISPLFGEMLAIWLYQTYQQIGSPQQVQLVELGPGKGTLASDVVRIFKKANLLPHLSIHLVECNPVLRNLQKQSISPYCENITWHDDLSTVPKAPTLWLANEFFDALPIEQFIYQDGRWHQRHIGLQDGVLRFIAKPTEKNMDCFLGLLPSQLHNGDMVEYSEDSVDVINKISKHINEHGGAGLFIDYGYDSIGVGDTLQSMKQHSFVSVFETPGDADITAHVHFPLLKEAAKQKGVEAFGCITQQQLLSQLGIGLRTKLLAEQYPQNATKLLNSTARLTDEQQMGSLFKAIAIMPQGHSAPYGF